MRLITGHTSVSDPSCASALSACVPHSMSHAVRLRSRCCARSRTSAEPMRARSRGTVVPSLLTLLMHV